MEGEAEQPALAAAEHARADVEERGAHEARAVVDQDLALLHDDEQAPRSVARAHQAHRVAVGRRGQARDERLQRDGRLARRRTRREEQRDDADDHETEDPSHGRSLRRSVGARDASGAR
jgi:hypothetical protein